MWISEQAYAALAARRIVLRMSRRTRRIERGYIPATTGQHMLDAGQLDALRNTIRGAVILPDDALYDEARHVYNAMIDRHPAIIIRCADVADVISAVNFGREAKLSVSVRGGSHNVTGIRGE